MLTYLGEVGVAEAIDEIIVVDGGSVDGTQQIAKIHGVTLLKSKKGRATQMNKGAQHAKGGILYFLHADTYPPKGFEKDILEAVNNGFQAGCFRMKFDTKNPFLRFFAWLSRINHTLCRGGDQSLFITKLQFEKQGGFNEDYLIYEDSEFIKRLYRTLKFKILQKAVTTSARRYRQKGWIKVQFHFGIIHLKNFLGAGPSELYRYYQNHILT